MVSVAAHQPRCLVLGTCFIGCMPSNALLLFEHFFATDDRLPILGERIADGIGKWG